MTLTLTSSPVAAAFGGAALATGVEREPDGTLRLYVTARWNGVFLRLGGPTADEVERLWNAATGHLWVTPVPPPDALFSEREDGET